MVVSRPGYKMNLMPLVAQLIIWDEDRDDLRWSAGRESGNKKVEDKIRSMRDTKQYKFLKVYLDKPIFQTDDEVKLGYLNIGGLLESDHADQI